MSLCFVRVNFKWPGGTSKPRLGTNTWNLESMKGQGYKFRKKYIKPIGRKGDKTTFETDHNYK